VLTLLLCVQTFITKPAYLSALLCCCLCSALQCPLTSSLFVEPVASKVCSHVFSKAAILNHIKICTKDRRDCKCPVAGCGRIIAAKDLEVHERTVDALKLQTLKVKAERQDDAEDEVCTALSTVRLEVF
jgi:SUMO ligase MMS21 Smc5/6 complex component